MFEMDEKLVQDVINYLIKQPFIEVHDLISRINTHIMQHAEKQKEEKKNADNTGS